MKEVHCKEVAKDLAQDTFIKFYEKCFNHLEEIDSIQGLLYRIAKNTISDYFRKKVVRNNYRTQIQEPVIFLEKTIINSLLLEDIKDAIIKKKIKLTEYEKIVFDVLFSLSVNPKSNKEIVQVTGLSIDMVTSAKNTLFKKLRSYFKGHR